MLVGVPREIKNHEYRVGITPTQALTNATLPYVLALAGKGWKGRRWKRMPGCARGSTSTLAW
ncbi:MAG: hypothetical protein ACYCTW_12280 [Sulfuricella sp.]